VSAVGDRRHRSGGRSRAGRMLPRQDAFVRIALAEGQAARRLGPVNFGVRGGRDLLHEAKARLVGRAVPPRDVVRWQLL
jgi:hypothetical protein